MQQDKGSRYSKIFRNFISFILCVFSCTFLFPESSYANITNNAEHRCQVKITNYHISKNIIKNNIESPSQNWINLSKLPHHWNHLWQPFEQSAWYKITFNYDCPHAVDQPVHILFDYLSLAGKVYINDELLWKSNSLSEPFSRHLHHPLNWSLPSSTLKQGPNNLLIQVFGTSTQNSGLGHVYIDTQDTVVQKFKSLHLEKDYLPTFTMGVNIAIGVFCFMVWFVNRDYITFLLFGITNFLWAFYIGTIFIVEPWKVFNNLTYDKLNLIIFCIYIYFACLSIWRFAGKKYPRIEKLLGILIGISTFLVLVTPHLYQPQLQLIVFKAFVAIFILKAITYPLVVRKTKFNEAYWMLTTQFVFVPVAFNDAYYMLTQKGHILTPYTTPFTSIFIGLVLALQLSRKSNRILKFNKTLEQSVIDAKNELSESLNHQHKLSLQNAKLRQRVQFSHDLHDGLGSSIITSMTLLEHEKLDQIQIKSIITQLRSDLRQIIDLGSSLDSKTPDSPVVWLAPLRRRYIEVLESIHIESKWIIPEQWTKIPPNQYCLTLSRILEESLTNIIKHSQATQAEIKFYQDEQSNLILRIQDNGVGFDTTNVHSTLHVGLSSMRKRIEKLNGKFEVHSHQNCTVIQACLNIQLPIEHNDDNLIT